MRKNYLLSSIAFLILIISGCSKDQTNAFSASVTATIGTNPFTSSQNNVNVGESPIVQGGTVGGTEQVTITATSNTSSDTYLVIAFGYAANDVKTYNVSDDQAICAYHTGSSGNDDLAQSGTVTITSNNTSDVSEGKHLTGTFDFITSGGTHITGDFSVQVNY